MVGGLNLQRFLHIRELTFRLPTGEYNGRRWDCCMEWFRVAPSCIESFHVALPKD